jgi:hypothetical protein
MFQLSKNKHKLTVKNGLKSKVLLQKETTVKPYAAINASKTTAARKWCRNGYTNF